LSGSTNLRKCFVLDSDVEDVGTSAVTWVTSGNAWDFEACRVCSYVPLLNLPTYNNGTQTLTANNTEEPYQRLIIDGVTLSTGDRVLVIGETWANYAQNGIYSVTTQGDSTTAWVLTRVAGFNTAAQPVYYNQCVWVTDGNRYRCTTWTLQQTVVTFGTTPVIWGQGEPNTEWTKCLIATTTILPNSPTQATANTLVSTDISTLTIDSYVMTNADIVLVKDQAVASQNGIYYMTTVGGMTPWVLTRLNLGWDSTAAGLARYGCLGPYMGGYVTYGAGSSATFNTYWYLSGPVVTVGTSAVNFVRAGSASQLKSVKYVAIANLTSTATTANSLTITTGQSIDQRAVNSTDMPLGTRILLTAQTTTTAQQQLLLHRRVITTTMTMAMRQQREFCRRPRRALHS
jgi:hypothetical protein